MFSRPEGMRRAPAMVSAIIVFSGSLACSSVESVQFQPNPDDGKAPPVRIYAGTRPACDYEEIGLVRWTRRSWWESLDKGANQMRRRAHEMGGHAIIDFAIINRATGVTTKATADTIGNVTSTTSVDSEYSASGRVIRFTDQNCR